MGIDHLVDLGLRVVEVIQRPGPPVEKERNFWMRAREAFSERGLVPCDPGLDYPERAGVEGLNHKRRRSFVGYVYEKHIGPGNLDVSPGDVVEQYLQSLRPNSY